MASAQNLSDARVDADWLAARLDDPSVRIVEIDVSALAYRAGHVPGAVLWNAYTDLRHPDYVPIARSELEDLLRRSGVARDTTVVFYGYGAVLGYWLMTSYAHPDARFMDGPRDRWLGAGRSWSLETAAPPRSDYALAARQAFHSSMQELRESIGARDLVLLDTRSRAEYDGERFWPSGAAAGAGRPGHLPGALHVPVEMFRTEGGDFRSLDDMAQTMHERGVAPATPLVAYCTIGNRASQVWFALRMLGYRDVKVYYGSWSEWGTTAGTPIER